MAMCRPAPALFALTLAASSMISGQGGAQDVHCRRDDLVRQVQVQFARDGDGLPCQVIWQSTAGAERRRLVWRSASELEYCTQKGRELVHQLIDSGWTCDARGPASRNRSAPAATVRLEPDTPAADAALPLRPEPEPPEQAAPVAGRAQEAAQPPDEAVLAAALERDVARLDQLAAPAPGGFAVEMARLGDLNGDGIEDAVALLTHRPEGAPPSQHLLAYLFDGETFQPVARRALSDPDAGFADAELQDIVDGMIAVVLHVAQSGDPECCPSGRRHMGFVLRDNQLVAAGRNRSGA